MKSGVNPPSRWGFTPQSALSFFFHSDSLTSQLQKTLTLFLKLHSSTSTTDWRCLVPQANSIMVIEKIYVLVIYVSVVQHFSLMFIYPSFPPKTGKGMILAGFSVLDLRVNLGKWPIQIFSVWCGSWPSCKKGR